MAGEEIPNITRVVSSIAKLRKSQTDDIDAAHRRTTMTYSDGSSQLRLDYTYSARDQITNVKRYTDTAGATLESETVYGLDDEGKALTITHKNAGGTTVDSFTYQYDLADRITRETSTLGPTNTYTYDRTTQVTGDGTESFAWDANGNPTGGGNTVTTGNRLTSDGTWTYTHDDAGNVIEKAKSGEYWFYGYDHNNRLTHLEKRTTEGGSSVLSIDFKYNIFGDRIQRDYDADGAGAGAAVVLKMAYENGNAWADMDSGLTVSTRRVYDGGLDSLVARINSGSQEDWYLTDVIGSVRDIVNGSGTLIDHIDYSVFGTPTETQPGSGDRYKFTGREWETEALIQYNRARYLQYGRWMSQDPMGFDAGDSNLYRYVGNNPVFLTDPTGLWDREAVTRILNQSDIGKKTLKTLAEKDVVVYKVDAIVIFEEVTVNKIPKIAERRDEILGLAVEQKKTRLIYCRSDLDDFLAAQTLVHEASNARNIKAIPFDPKASVAVSNEASMKIEIEAWTAGAQFIAHTPGALTRISKNRKEKYYNNIHLQVYFVQRLFANDFQRDDKYKLIINNEAIEKHVRTYYETIFNPKKGNLLTDVNGNLLYSFEKPSRVTGWTLK